MKNQEETVSSSELADYMSEIENDEALLPEEMLNDKAWSKELVVEKHDDGTIKPKSKVVLFKDKSEAAKARVEKLNQFNKKRSLDLKQKKLQIQREALQSNFVNLYDKIKDEQKQQLIKLLTNDYYEAMTKSKAFIDSRLKTLLNRYIPKVIKRCKTMYPNSMVKSPGFMYIASEEHGEGIKLWVNPDIPYYISQGSEMQLLNECCKPELFSIDKAVVKHVKSKSLLAKKEISCAVALRKIKTYYDLVTERPLWYEILINDMKKNMQ